MTTRQRLLLRAIIADLEDEGRARAISYRAEKIDVLSALAAEPAPEPLTDEEISEALNLLNEADDAVEAFRDIARIYGMRSKAEPAPELTNEEIEAVISGMNRKLTGFQGWGWLDVARAVLKAQKEKQA